MVGEHLGFGGVSDYAAAMMDQNVDGSSEDGYTTVGIPTSIYTVDRLYERDMSWSRSTLASRINNGVHIINHLGHGSPGYAMKFYSSDILSYMNNTDHCFVYSQTCLAGHFDGTDCWAEYMTIKSDNGGFAVVMNARYGWGSGYTTDGPSQRFNREFWDAVFNPEENKNHLGMANQDSKEDNLYRISQNCMRWCYYELNLFGDPTIAIKGSSAWFSADTTYGWTPLEVNFEGQTSLTAVDTWTWSFGDGDSAFVRYPSHNYDERGLYDVGIQIEADTVVRSNMRNDFIIVLGDTLKVDSIEADPGQLIEVPIRTYNTIPLKQIRIPIEYSGDLVLTPQAVEMTGCRTEHFDGYDFNDYDPNNNCFTVTLDCGSAAPLDPGEGAVAIVKFQVAGDAVSGQSGRYQCQWL